jgi:hypothetical protein
VASLPFTHINSCNHLSTASLSEQLCWLRGLVSGLAGSSAHSAYTSGIVISKPPQHWRDLYHAYGLRLRKAAVRYTSLYLGGAYVQSAPCCIRLYGSRHSRNLASLAPLHRAFCLPCHRQRRRTPCTDLMFAMLTYNAAALPCT